MKANLLNFDLKGMQDFCVAQNEKPFRGTQLFKWIHQYGISDFSLMSNISKAFREKLNTIAEILLPEVQLEKVSEDGTHKWLLKLSCGNCIETVYIPESGRGTLCVSSQVGCALNCSFCSTGRQGFNRNLSVAEIISQVWVAVRSLSKSELKHDRQVTNVVMMGMGEPLMNFDNVLSAMSIMTDDNGYGLSKYKVTLSTSGLVPEMDKLSQLSSVSLAVSLHAPTNTLRDVLVPINKKYPLEELMAACKRYFADEPRRHITFEYVMLDGINDSPNHAKQLLQILQGVPAKVNLIPFNSFPGTEYKRSSAKAIQIFTDILSRGGLNTITRKTRGDDIDAACGQLVGSFEDRTSRRRLIETRQTKSLGEA